MKNNFIFRSIEACNDFSDRIEIIRMSLIYIHIHQYLKLNFSVNHLESPIMMWIKSNKSRLDQMIDQWITFAIDDFVQIFHRQHHKWIHNFETLIHGSWSIFIPLRNLPNGLWIKILLKMKHGDYALRTLTIDIRQYEIYFQIFFALESYNWSWIKLLLRDAFKFVVF